MKCKSAALFSLRAFTEGRQRKVTSRLRKLVFSEWHRGCLQHVTRAYSLDLHPVLVLVHFYKTKFNSLTKSFVGHAVDLDKSWISIHQHDILWTMPWWGCPSCLDLDQAKNNPRVTLLPLRVTDQDKWEKADEIPCVEEKFMAKPQKIFCFVQRHWKKRLLLPKDTEKLVVIDEEGPEAPRLSSCSSVWGICGKLWTLRIFCGTFFQLKFLLYAFCGTATARGRSNSSTMT